MVSANRTEAFRYRARGGQVVLHDRLRPHLGRPFVAAVPNRDILVCFRNREELVPVMRAQTAEGYRTMPHQISEALFLVTADGLAPFEPL